MQTKKKQIKKDPTDKILKSERNLTHRQKTLSRAKGTAKSMLKGAIVGAGTVAISGVSGGRNKTERSGKLYRGLTAGGAVMGAMTGYRLSKQEQAKKKREEQRKKNKKK
tara:strand:- start:893 stop:1219 length:327 start_codon:yes stop_codon:yes gene_type:complete